MMNKSRTPQSNSSSRQEQRNVLVIGGSGFLGQAVCNALVKTGYRVTVPTRRYRRAKHLLVLPNCHIVQTNIHDRAALGRLVAGQDIVINLLGVLHSATGKPYGQQFRTSHVEFPKALTASMTQHKVKRLIHISALGVGVQNPAPSMYLRSKTDGEAIVKDSPLAWTMLRPSVVFGRQDSFLNTFAKLASLPVFPLGCGNTRMQPVFVDDVARAVLACVQDTTKETIHSTYDLAGPEVFTLKQLVQLAAKAAGKNPWIVPIPTALAKMQAQLLRLLPGPPLATPDNFDSLSVDNIHTSGKLFPLPHYEALSALAPQYLRESVQPTTMDQYRQQAHRSQ